uniref:Endonuclease/exonuclease/phosphatase n=1 Tax=Sphingobacterium sp. (strain 21) TaxID=743722 RepID=F4CEJ9_SPHS2
MTRFYNLITVTFLLITSCSKGNTNHPDDIAIDYIVSARVANKQNAIAQIDNKSRKIKIRMSECLDWKNVQIEFSLAKGVTMSDPEAVMGEFNLNDSLPAFTVKYQNNEVSYTLEAEKVWQRCDSKRIMSYNIFIGKGMDEVIDLSRSARIIKEYKPDLVALQEVDSIAERSGWVDQPKELGRLTGMNYIFAPATPRSKGKYGIAVLTKEKPLAYHYMPLPGQEEPRTLLIVEFQDYIFCNVHLSLNIDSRRQSIPIINEALKLYTKPIILAGDFNSLPVNDDIIKIQETWQYLSDPSLKTMPSNDPIWTLDYIWGYKANGHAYKVSNTKVIEEKTASDHLPVYVDVEF